MSHTGSPAKKSFVPWLSPSVHASPLLSLKSFQESFHGVSDALNSFEEHAVLLILFAKAVGKSTIPLRMSAKAPDATSLISSAQQALADSGMPSSIAAALLMPTVYFKTKSFHSIGTLAVTSFHMSGILCTYASVLYLVQIASLKPSKELSLERSTLMGTISQPG